MKAFSFIGVAAAMLILSGCADKKEVIAKIDPVVSNRCTVDSATAPDWVCVGEKLDGHFVAKGYSSASKAGHGITNDRAYNDAVGNLALKVSTDIKAKMTSFTETTGIDKYETVDTAFEKVVKQSSKLQANDIETIKYWEHPKNGGIYLLVGVEKGNIYAKAKQDAKAAFSNSNALRQHLLMKDAEKALEEEFKETPSAPVVTQEASVPNNIEGTVSKINVTPGTPKEPSVSAPSQPVEAPSV
jgi:hypothetical protein